MAVTQTLTGPARVARKGGISSLAEVQEDARLGAIQDVVFFQEPCEFPRATIALCWEDLEAAVEKTAEGVVFSDAIGDPFVLYGGYGCFLGDDEDHAQLAGVVLSNGEDQALEEQLATWAEAATPALTGIDLVSALAQVEDAMDTTYVGSGIIIVNRGDAVRLDAEGALKRSGDEIHTINGTRVLATSKATENVVSGVGAVKITASPVRTAHAVNHRYNTDLALAERIYAILVDCEYRTTATVTP